MADLGQSKERQAAMSHKQGSERTATFGKIGKLGGGIKMPIRMQSNKDVNNAYY